ncbi:MAG: VWA domain-containing protein [Gemmataceae bacterium]|nr:VWA domain-containing protein [Gemmataceae bacterium]
MNQPWRSSCLLSLALVLGGSGIGRAAPANESKSIDVVLCLDVSSSMEGLIEVAKIRLWDLVNDLARARPTPKLRVALYSYGHVSYSEKDGWVRKEIDLTHDLDAVYQRLNELMIHGGQEYVARVSHAALTDQRWFEGSDGLRLIFVCGNEPATQDPEVTLAEGARLARQKSVIINTIYCNWGNAQPGENEDWKKFARDAGGQFALIEYDRTLHQIKTPFDDELSKLNDKLNSTFVPYGKRGVERQMNQLIQDSNAKFAGVDALAGRLGVKAGALYQSGDWCIVSRAIDDPNFDVNRLRVDDLPDVLRNLKPAERSEWVKKKVAERKEIQKQISELTAKRGRHVEEVKKKNSSAAEKQFDAALRRIIREQCGKVGIEIPDKP